MCRNIKIGDIKMSEMCFDDREGCDCESTDNENYQVDPKETVFARGHRPIRFYCQKCGKELFEGIDLNEHINDTIGGFILASGKCDDCLLQEIRVGKSN